MADSPELPELPPALILEEDPPPALAPEVFFQNAPPITAPTNPISARHVIQDSLQPTSKPNRLRQSVWERLTEYRLGGGLLDISEEVAALSDTEAQIFEAISQGKIDMGEGFRALLRAQESLIRAKEKDMNLREKRKAFVTNEMFAGFLEDLFTILQKRLQDPFLLKQIGEDIFHAANRATAPLKG